MRAKYFPFNVTIMDNSKSKFSSLPEITTLDIFDGATRELHPGGLFSVPIFGAMGDEKRLDSFAHINLNTEVIHPFIYEHIVALKGLYGEIASGKAYATWNEKISDFERADQLTGDTGYSFFMKKVKSIKFKKSNSTKRNKSIQMIEQYKDRMFIKYLVVEPAGMRDIEINDGRTKEDEINDFYRKAMRGAATIVGTEESTNNKMNDVARFTIQMAVVNIFDTLFSILKGKKGFALAKWYGRRVVCGTANVISNKELTSIDLSKGDIYDPRVTYCGMSQAMTGNRAKTTYALRNSILSTIFTQDEVHLVNEKHQPVTIKSTDKLINRWASVEGIDRLIDGFTSDKVRNAPLKVNNHYLCNIYDDGKNTLLFTRWSEVGHLINGTGNTVATPTFEALVDAKVVRHATYAEVMYLCLAEAFEELYGTITRYPVIGFGSIFVSRVKVKTTAQGETRHILKRDGSEFEVHQFPRKGEAFVNTMQIDVTKIKGLNAD